MGCNSRSVCSSCLQDRRALRSQEQGECRKRKEDLPGGNTGCRQASKNNPASEGQRQRRTEWGPRSSGLTSANQSSLRCWASGTPLISHCLLFTSRSYQRGESSLSLKGERRKRATEHPVSQTDLPLPRRLTRLCEEIGTCVWDDLSWVTCSCSSKDTEPF